MALTIELTTDWSPEKIAPHWNDIFRCFSKYVERFEGEETVVGMFDAIMSGKRQLWVVKDETGRVILTPITETRVNDATGEVVVRMAEIGGERLQEAMPLVEEIERWARDEQGATTIELIGRKGWERLLKPFDYAPYVQIYRKAI
jgi:hypothetical protein